MNETINVVISVSWRVECLNLLLDILKNNFEKNYRTYVFCNVAKTEKDVLNKIDMSLIDEFAYCPDEDCSLSKQEKMNNKKLHAKRLQPARLWATIAEVLEANNIGKFIYTECDFYPMVEEAYISGFEGVTSDNFACKFVELNNPKVPFGYMCPCPMYFGSTKTIGSIGKNMAKNGLDMVQRGYAFEGMLAKSAIDTSIPFIVTSDHMFTNHDPNCLDPVTKTLHNHNILDVGATLTEYGITKGNHVNRAINEDKIVQAWDGITLTRKIDKVLRGPSEK
tara:strand:- start:2248 stop:3084 length:837 start_codon:yes stop_codon:yes gene_type:complete